MQIHTPSGVQGGVVGPPPPPPPTQSHWYVAVFRNDFAFGGKPLIFFTRWGIFYGWWGCWGVCDVTNNGRHLGYHLGLYQELEIRLKPWELVIFCAWDENTWHKIYFYCWKNMYFHAKTAWPPPNYDVISRNYRNWPSLNLTQNVREGWTNSYCSRGKLRNFLGGGIPPFTSEG